MRLIELLFNLAGMRRRLAFQQRDLEQHSRGLKELNRTVDRLQQQANWNARMNEGALEAMKQRVRRLEGVLLALEGTLEVGEDVPKDSHFWHN